MLLEAGGGGSVNYFVQVHGLQNHTQVWIPAPPLPHLSLCLSDFVSEMRVFHWIVVQIKRGNACKLLDSFRASAAVFRSSSSSPRCSLANAKLPLEYNFGVTTAPLSWGSLSWGGRFVLYLGENTSQISARRARLGGIWLKRNPWASDTTCARSGDCFRGLTVSPTVSLPKSSLRYLILERSRQVILQAI